MPPTPSEQVQGPVSGNTALQAANAQLRAANGLLEQKIRVLQVTATILLAISAGSIVGMATRMTGAAVPTALGSGFGVFFAVIMALMAILGFVHKSPSALS